MAPETHGALANPYLARHIALAYQQRQHRITRQLAMVAMVVEIFISGRDSIEGLRHQFIDASPALLACPAPSNRPH